MIYEGPWCFPLEPAAVGKPATWCLLLDFYSGGGGYEPYVTHDLGGGQFTPINDFNFSFRFRHGAVLPLTALEYQRLTAA